MRAGVQVTTQKAGVSQHCPTLHLSGGPGAMQAVGEAVQSSTTCMMARYMDTNSMEGGPFLHHSSCGPARGGRRVGVAEGWSGGGSAGGSGRGQQAETNSGGQTDTAHAEHASTAQAEGCAAAQPQAWPWCRAPCRRMHRFRTGRRGPMLTLTACSAAIIAAATSACHLCNSQHSPPAPSPPPKPPRPPPHPENICIHIHPHTHTLPHLELGVQVGVDAEGEEGGVQVGPRVQRHLLLVESQADELRSEGGDVCVWGGVGRGGGG
jgi:hypothetical protein